MPSPNYPTYNLEINHVYRTWGLFPDLKMGELKLEISRFKHDNFQIQNNILFSPDRRIFANNNLPEVAEFEIIGIRYLLYKHMC